MDYKNKAKQEAKQEPEQHSLGWYRARLGHITGSEAGKLIAKGRNSRFSETARSYLYKVAAERLLNPEIVNDDDMFRLYVDQQNVSSKAIRWGIEQEENARRALMKAYLGYDIAEAPSVQHDRLDYFASSPDGLFVDTETGELCAVEIKCLAPDTWARFAETIEAGGIEALRKLKPEYYWQCQSHMACTGASCCLFVLYNPFTVNPLLVYKLDYDPHTEEELIEAVEDANKEIERIADALK